MRENIRGEELDTTTYLQVFTHTSHVTKSNLLIFKLELIKHNAVMNSGSDGDYTVISSIFVSL